MSYKVEYLPLALADLKDAVVHISDELGMPRAAGNLLKLSLATWRRCLIFRIRIQSIHLSSL